MSNKYPKISIVIPTRGVKNHPFLDSEKYINSCLESVFKQTYPKARLEVLVVDGGSTDNTLEIARGYPVKILHNKRQLAEPAKTLGFKYATGDIFFYLDSDAELVSRKALENLIYPFLDDPEIVGSFTRYLPSAKQTAFNRYVSYNPLQLWSMLSFLLPSIKEATIEKRKRYDVVEINLKRNPPVGICLYRKSALDQIIKYPDKFTYVDIAIPLQLAEIGLDKFAYVEDAGLYHRRNNLLRELRRQKRDVTVTYLPDLGKRKFNYVDFSNPFDLLKIVLWVIYVNLVIPSFIVGVYKTLKHKDLAMLYELPTNFLLTNYIIWLFLSDAQGRTLLKNILYGRKAF